MSRRKHFGYFDPTQEYFVTFGRLPHWEQPGASYFITFRTADSLPRSALDLWERRRADWLARNGVDSAAADWHVGFLKLPLEKQLDFQREFSAELERQLDTGWGACRLREPAVSQVMAEALLHFDNDRYWLADFVVMPNHVHLLVCFAKHIRLRDQCYSWKHFTARAVNKLLGRRGDFWQSESFDHLVRSPEHFDQFRKYIAENPSKAGLSAGEYHYYRCEDI